MKKLKYINSVITDFFEDKYNKSRGEPYLYRSSDKKNFEILLGESWEPVYLDEFEIEGLESTPLSVDPDDYPLF